MKIFERYEIYDSETGKIYMTAYFDLLANISLNKIKEKHYFARLRMIHREV